MVDTWGYYNGVSAGTPLGIGNWPNGEGSLTLTGTEGSSTLTIDSVNVGVIGDYALDSQHASTSWGIVIPGDDGVYRVYSVYAVDTVNMTLSVFPQLAATSTAQLASNFFDAYGGPHLTTLGFYGLADYVVAQTKGTSYIQNYAARYVSDGLGNYSGTPWTAIGGLNQGQGGYVSPTNCMTQGVFTYASHIDNAICNAYSGTDRTEFNGSYYQTLIGAATQGQGAQLTANLNGRSGYLDTYVGIEGQYETEQASARVQVYIDGNLVLNQNFGGITHVRVPFTHASSGEIDVTVDSPYPCAPRISNATWYVWDDSVWAGASPSDPLIPDGSTVLVLEDSWGTWHNAAFVTRLQQDLPNSPITNVSVGGTTAEWAITNFSTLTTGGPYDYIISDFQINDLQPDIHVIPFTQLLSELETLWNMDLGIGATPIYLRSLATATAGRIERLNEWDQTLTADYPVQIESQGEQQITFPNPGPQSYGVSPISLAATASSGLPVSYSILSGPAAVNGNILTIAGAGSVTVQASQTGNSNWLAATPVTVTFSVAPAVLTVSANNTAITYGCGCSPVLTYSIAGFVNGDGSGVVSGAPVEGASGTQAGPVGSYPITIAQGTLAAQNYIFTFANGVLAVNPATLTVTANNATMTEGSQLPAFSATYSGFVNGDNQSALTGSPVFTTDAPQNPPVGQYNIFVTQGTLWAQNYVFNFVNGTLTVNPAVAQITSPANNSMLSGSSVTFTWSHETNAVSYELLLGSTPGGSDIASLTTADLSATINNLPTDGSYVYATLLGSTDGVNYSQQNTATYVAYTLIAVMTSPAPNSTLSGASVTFTWIAGAGSSAYWIDAGSTPGGNNYEQSGNLGNVTSLTVNNLPTDGNPIYVTLWSQVNGQWLYNEYQYTAYSSGSIIATMSTPVPGSTLGGTSQLFAWNAGTESTAYWIDAGSTQGGNQYFQSGNLGSQLSDTVTGLPADGSTVYITLWSQVNGQWLYNEYQYTAYSLSSGAGQITNPAPGSTLPGPIVTFNWSAGMQSTAYWLDIGNVPGGNQYFQSGNLGNVLQVTVNGLPTDGSQVFATLYSLIGGQWIANSYTFTAAGSSNLLAVMQSPTPGSDIIGTQATFTWTAGSNAQGYWLDIGSTQGANDIYQSGDLGTELSATVYTLPNDGSQIWATLWTLVNGQWSYNEYQYTSGTSSSKPLNRKKSP